MMVIPLITNIIISCAAFSLDHQCCTGANVISGIMVGTSTISVGVGTRVGSMISCVGAGVRMGVGVREFSVTTTSYWQNFG